MVDMTVRKLYTTRQQEKMREEMGISVQDTK